MKTKTQILIFFHLLFLSSLSVRAQTWQWATKAGGPGNDYSNSMDIDNSGNSYVTGKFIDSISFDSITLVNPGVWSVYIAKYNPEGNILWAKIAASDSSISVNSIHLDKYGNVLIAGQYFATASFGVLPVNLTSSADYDVYIAKYDTAGNLLWARSLGGQGIDYAGDIGSDPYGNVFLTGDFHFSPFQFSGGKIFLAKYDQDGNQLWFKISTDYGTDNFGNGIKVDSMGNSFITGEFFNTLVFDSLLILDAGNVESNAFILKFDSSGTILWGQRAGASSGYCGSKSIEIDEAGNSFITGYYHGTITLGSFNITSTMGTANEIFIAKCDIGGNFVWVNKSIGAGTSRTISSDHSGNYFISGSFSQDISFDLNSLSSTGSNDIYLAEINSSGNFIWATSCGGVQSDYIAGMKANSDGIFITGTFTDTIHFGTSLSLGDNSANTDIFLTKLDNSSGIPETQQPSAFSVFPNPAAQFVTAVTSGEKGQLVLCDCLGNEVIQKNTGNEMQTVLDISSLPGGIYFLQFRTAKGVSATKVVCYHENIF